MYMNCHTLRCDTNGILVNLSMQRYIFSFSFVYRLIQYEPNMWEQGSCTRQNPTSRTQIQGAIESAAISRDLRVRLYWTERQLRKRNAKEIISSQVGIYFVGNKLKNGALEVSGSNPRRAVWNIFIVSLIWKSGNGRELRKKNLKAKPTNCHKALSVWLFLCITGSTHNCFSKFSLE